MTLILHGRLNSSNVQKVVLACEELRLPYLRHDAGGAFGIVQTDAYKAMNPNALVPVLIDGDLVLWESNAIVRYLAAKYSEGGLWPSDAGERALTDRWMDWVATALAPAMNMAFRMLVRTPPEKRDQTLIDASIIETEKAMDVLEAHLGDRVFLLGDRITMGDITLAPNAFRWLHMPVARKARPNAEAWVARMTARPGFDKALFLPIT
jgi:glutathione S-transferase